MHLLIPHAAALDPACLHTLADLGWRHLPEVLKRLAPTERLGADEFDPIAPHEHALAAAWGWREGALPFAARSAKADGVDVGERAWALLTPVHWHVGREQVTLADPASLALDEAESRQLFDAARPLFESEGFTCAFGAASRWYVANDTFADLRCASLDRVVARNVDRWMPEGTQARLVRRLQNEVQMLLYTHPVNDAREARGALPVNSFWLSGCGRWQASDESDVRVDERLRAPLFAQDWAAYADAWRAIDTGAVAELLAGLKRGEPARLTLCGERHAQRFEPTDAPWWKRIAQSWQGVEPHAVLEAL